MYCRKRKLNCLSILLFIIAILEWYLYLFIAFRTEFSVLWKSRFWKWSVVIFKLGTILIKNSLKTSAISLSSDIIFSSSKISAWFSFCFLSVSVIFDLILTLSVRKGFTVFQKVLYTRWIYEGVDITRRWTKWYPSASLLVFAFQFTKEW